MGLRPCRTNRRHFLFRPDPEINQAFIDCLGVCAKKFGVLVHVAILMSDHLHLVVTDPQGRLPLFNQDLNRLYALVTPAVLELAVEDEVRTMIAAQPGSGRPVQPGSGRPVAPLARCDT